MAEIRRAPGGKSSGPLSASSAGFYRARPVLRVRIPKEDGGQRLLGIPSIEDKVFQRATAEVLNAVYEVDFLGFSYGFRRGRRQHQALDAPVVGIETKGVNWVLDADIRGFFDAIDHDWLVRFVEHRIADKRVVRHLKKWLQVGVLEDGKRSRMEVGTPQGGRISPLLANIYLHYALDLWVQQWRRTKAHGEVIIVRWADDCIMGFQHKSDALKFWGELAERLRRFNLELHPDKTKLLEFGRFAAANRKKRGERKPKLSPFSDLRISAAKRERDGLRRRVRLMPSVFEVDFGGSSLSCEGVSMILSMPATNLRSYCVTCCASTPANHRL